MSSDLPASFYRAEAAWLNPPENSPEYDEWLDAQEEKKDLMKAAEMVLEDMPYEIESWDDLDSAVFVLSGKVEQLATMREQLGILCDDFPDNEPDPDSAYDDSWYGV